MLENFASLESFLSNSVEMKVMMKWMMRNHTALICLLNSFMSLAPAFVAYNASFRMTMVIA